jgi:hypothetical protein
MDAREAAGTLAMCKWLKDQVKTWEAAAKDVLSHALTTGEKSAAISPDGQVLGFVTAAKGKRSMKIDNEAGFLAWVQQRYPTEVEQSVRPAFVKACQEKTLKYGALIDGAGEVCPHVSLHEGDGYTMVTLNELADYLIRERFKARPALDAVTPKSELPGASEHISEAQDYDAGTIVPVAEGDSASAAAEQPPDLEDEQVGPPNWGESNTFETSDAVRLRRGETT